MEATKDLALELARAMFEQGCTMLGEEWSEYHRGWTHGIIDTLDSTDYSVSFGLAWSDDFSNWYLQRVELVRYLNEAPWAEVIEREVC